MTTPAGEPGATTPPDLLEVGKIGRPHGVRGDLVVTFTSDVASRREPGARLVVTSRSGPVELLVESCRVHGERHVVHFAGIDDRTAAERLVNLVLFAEPVAGGDDTLWVHELIGSRVVDATGREWGTCVSVIANPAHDILEVSNGALVPAVFVVSCADGITRIDPPEGLEPESAPAG
ncbi:MAG: ribosome maturation factor RimM [Ilumatobacteraceae bacterium]